MHRWCTVAKVKTIYTYSSYTCVFCALSSAVLGLAEHRDNNRVLLSLTVVSATVRAAGAVQTGQ